MSGLMPSQIGSLSPACPHDVAECRNASLVSNFLVYGPLHPSSLCSPQRLPPGRIGGQRIAHLVLQGHCGLSDQTQRNDSPLNRSQGGVPVVGGEGTGDSKSSQLPDRMYSPSLHCCLHSVAVDLWHKLCVLYADHLNAAHGSPACPCSLLAYASWSVHALNGAGRSKFRWVVDLCPTRRRRLSDETAASWMSIGENQSCSIRLSSYLVS
jgi:hypothetical protein